MVLILNLCEYALFNKERNLLLIQVILTTCRPGNCKLVGFACKLYIAISRSVTDT